MTTDLIEELNPPSHPHEEIHMPPPSHWPLVFALGFSVLGFGLMLKSGRMTTADSFLPIAGVDSLLTFLSSIWIAIASVGGGLLFLAIGGWVMSNIAERNHAPDAFQGDIKMAMWVFLGNEVLFFTGLIASFLLLRVKSDPGVDHALVASIPLVSLNTFILLTSSLNVVLAHDAAVRGKQGLLKLNLFLTIVFGSVFVALQGVEYSNLYAEGLTWTSSGFGTAFFTLTGVHGLHVILGIVWAIIIFARSLFGGFDSKNYGGVEIFGLYWHFVDVVWILLFTLVYLMHTQAPLAEEHGAQLLRMIGMA